ncbi:MAG: alpha/beta fold hydrolase [Anaerolineales bacterium]|nr:alpha/beta fold hydrolase [Anaerolineales bacterium]
MALDLALYRRQVRVSDYPDVRLSAIDIYPEHPNKTIVFIHGYGGQGRQWEYQLWQFSNDNRVIAIDLRGHGRSDKPEGKYSMSTIKRDLKTALDVLGVKERVVLVGHSFGGAIATEFTVAHPERVERLILIATAGEFHLNPLYRLLLRFPRRVINTLGPFTQKWLSAPPHVMHSLYHNNLSKWNGWSLFRSIDVPTMIIHGHQDRVFEKPLFEEVTRAIPKAEEINVGASGHLVMLERREAVNRAIQRFLVATPGTWRDVSSSDMPTSRDALVNKRNWLSYYDKGVPYTIAVPRVPLHYLFRSASNRFPHHSFIQFEGKRISYRQMAYEVNRFSRALRSLDVDKGDRVMLLLPNLPQMVIGFFGTLEAGAVAVFSLPTTDAQTLTNQIHDTGTKVILTLDQFTPLFEQVLDNLNKFDSSPLEHIILSRTGEYVSFDNNTGLGSSPKQSNHLPLSSLGSNIHEYRQILANQSRSPMEIDVSSEEPAVIQFTGGTTAAPKGVTLSHQSLLANALQTRHWMPNAEEGRERFLCVIPFSHSYGLTTGLNMPVALGATLILKSKFDLEDILKTIKKYHPTIFPGVPNMYMAIMDFPGVRKYGIESIKACISGSAPLPVEVQEAFEKLTRGRLVEGYGLTEAGPVTHANPLEGPRKVGCIGIPLPSTESRIVDLIDGHQEVKTGQIGELAVRGPQVMLGYWNNPTETKQVLSPDGWLLTGDVAQIDAEGYFRIIARKADMWYPDKPDNPAFPRDVEEVLFEVPQVKEVAVVGIANQPIAFVIAHKDRPKTEALTAYCKRRLPPNLVPRIIIFVDDFPRTFIGKVIRRELAKRYEQHQKDLIDIDR